MILNRLYIILILCSLWSIMPLSHLSAQGKNFTIVIDPGHGGKDPGAIGKKGKEKNIKIYFEDNEDLDELLTLLGGGRPINL